MRDQAINLTSNILRILILLVVVTVMASPLYAQKLQVRYEQPKAYPYYEQNNTHSISKSSPESTPDGDTYSLAPLLQDDEYYYFMTDAGKATSHQFDQEWKTIGTNQYGTTGSKLILIENVRELDNGDIQISIQVTAVNSQNEEEPWVDEMHSGSGFTDWRLDIGTLAGGINPITPDGMFKVVGSGVVLYDSAGEKIGDYSLNDTSDSSGLSGYTFIGWDDGTEVAGYDMSTIIVYWTVEIESNDTGFQASGGQSGAWYDPSHDGEGYVLQIISKTQAVVYWFTYDKSGKQYWMLGLGDVNGSKVVFDDLQTTKGGKFGPNFDPDDVEQTHWGSLEFNFNDCDNAIATYKGPSNFGSGTLNVTRLSKIWGVECSGGNSVTSGTGAGYLAPGFSGSWYDVRHDGEGFTFEILDETTALIFWYTYDTEGNQAWMSMLGTIDGATIFAPEVYMPAGARFGSEFDPNDVVRKEWGAAVFSFGTCVTSGGQHGGSMRYLPPPDFGVEGSQLLNRLVLIDGLNCAFLTDTHNISGTMTVAENIFIDGDVNDPNVEEFPNDLDSDSVQQLVPPAKVAGFVTSEATGKQGDRFESENDEWDIFILALREGEGISLTISDWNPSDTASVDLDLYIVDVNDKDNTAGSSLTLNEVETVIAPHDGSYFVYVNAVEGQSNYLLQSGQSGQTANSTFDITQEFVSGQIMASIRDTKSLTSNTEKDDYRSRIERTESKLGLTRIEESSEGDLLYEIDNSQTYRLVPHPLTLAGFGSITPEEWLVIRVAKSLASNSDYRWVGPNYISRKLEIPNDPGFEAQWHYAQIRLPEAWDVTRGGDDTVVAVLDSGIYDHQDLTGNVDYALGYDFVSDIFNSGDGDGIDSDARDPGDLYPTYQPYLSHGTHVAGTVGARTNNGVGVAGVNWDVTLMPVRVCGLQGCSCWDTNEGLRWAGRLTNSSGQLPSDNADIVNMSLGGPSSCPGMQEIINQLASRDIIVIAAAGNAGNTIPNYPASLFNVVSVSATTLADKLAYYSSYGSNIDLSAPGGDASVDLDNDSYPDGVLSPAMIIEEGSSQKQTGYYFLQGTSMASPHVAGVAALMKSVYPDLGPGEFRTAVSSGKITVDLAQNGETSKDPEFGYGRIDALEAVQWAVKAEQGQETDAFMTSSASALDFSSSLQSIDLIIEKAGVGNLKVSETGWTDSWITMSSVNLDSNGFGQYQVLVNRDELIDGQYSGWIAFDADNGSRLWVSVLMRVGEAVSGEAGYVYGLLLDQWTVQNVKYWHGPQIASGFDFDLDEMPPGTYYLMVSTDLDNDFTVCDDGELCELYPSNSEVSGIVITNSDIELGTFRMGFPAPNLKSASESSMAVMNSMDASKPAPRRLLGQERIIATRPRD